MIINNNIPALNTYRQLGINQNSVQKSMEKLSSGLRINKAGDDAAGLAISEKMRGQIRGLDQASRNASDGISLIQTAEGGLNESHSILQRMRELAVQASNDSNTAGDRKEIQKEIGQLTEELDRIGNNTEFNTQKLLDGSISDATVEQATKISSNEAFTTDGTTAATGAALLVGGLQDGNGNDLGLQVGDTLSIELTVNGTLETASVASIDANSNIDALLTAIGGMDGVASAAITDGKLVVTGNDGVQNAITSLNIQASDADGNTRTAFNNFSNDLSETQSAQDTSTNDTRVFHIGSNSNQNIKLGISDMRANALGVGGINVENQTGANSAIKVINSAIEKVSAQRSDLGSVQNRLEHTISNLDNSSENLSAAESRIRDVDMAKEMMEMTRANILSQASQSMLAQAQQQPQSVLQLLQ